ncbi:hypothetical protein [Oceanobacillus sp. CAU 1775]
MGLFSFFKRSPQPQEEVSKESYWSLTTNEDEVIDPTWVQIKAAVQNATPDRTVFASLAYFHSDIEIEVVQVIGEDGWYRFEAVSPERVGKRFVNDGISYEEAIKLFEEFFKYKRVVGYRSWPTEKF